MKFNLTTMAFVLFTTRLAIIAVAKPKKYLIETENEDVSKDEHHRSKFQGRKPNIVYIVVDDVGFADIGCFGNRTIPTPNIDKLCQQGMKLTHHLATYALCTPSRVSLLTGRYASRAGMAQLPDSSPVLMYTAGRIGLPENVTTWAKLLKNNGYKTAAVGKWHVGWNKEKWGDQKLGPLGHGFDYFCGLPFTLVHTFHDAQYENFFSIQRLNQNQDFLPDLFMNVKSKASRILKGLMQGSYRDFNSVLMGLLSLKLVAKKPFLVTLMILIGFWFTKQHMNIFEEQWYRRSNYMDAWLNSHIMEMPGNKILMQPIDQTSSSSLLNFKAASFIRSKSKQKVPWLLYYSLTEAHTPLIVEQEFQGKSIHGPYGDTIIQMDAMIGRVLDTIDKVGEADNTFVYFTSDHGGHIDIGVEGGWNAPFSGGKGIAAREGGIRVPGIVRWPGRVKPGSILKQPTTHMDLMPTLIEITGSKMPDAKLDGKSILPQLTGISRKRIHSFLFHHCGTDIHAMRWNHPSGNVYKLVVKEPRYTQGRITDGTKAHCGGLCKCFGEEKITIYDKPKLYHIENDPEQIRPIVGKLYDKVVPTMLSKLEELKEDEGKTNMKGQMAQMWRVLPAPWLQPCCDFPLCRCDGTKKQNRQNLNFMSKLNKILALSPEGMDYSLERQSSTREQDDLDD